VNARLVAPDGSQQPVDVGTKTAVGTYRFPLAATAPEGSWRFVVDSTDDLGRASQAERSFSLNNTLASITVGSVRRGGTVRGGFTLSRAAQVRGTILTASGLPLRSLPARNRAAGTQTITWNGRSTYGSLVRAGRYQLRVTAQNAVGTVSLTAPFTIRRR
jgi:hypothetical protein